MSSQQHMLMTDITRMINARSFCGYVLLVKITEYLKNGFEDLLNQTVKQVI